MPISDIEKIILANVINPLFWRAVCRCLINKSFGRSLSLFMLMSTSQLSAFAGEMTVGSSYAFAGDFALTVNRFPCTFKLFGFRGQVSSQFDFR